MCLWFFCELQVFMIFCVKFFLLVRNMKHIFVTSNNILRFSEIQFGKHFKQLLSELTPHRFWSSVNICDINLVEIFHTFQIGFKMKCTRNGDMPTALTILLIVYMPSLSTITLTFETFTLLVTTKGRPDIAASLMHYLPVRNNFLHLRTVFTLSVTKTSPDVVNHFFIMDKNLLYDTISGSFYI